MQALRLIPHQRIPTFYEVKQCFLYLFLRSDKDITPGGSGAVRKARIFKAKDKVSFTSFSSGDKRKFQNTALMPSQFSQCGNELRTVARLAKAWRKWCRLLVTVSQKLVILSGVLKSLVTDFKISPI